MDAGIVVAIVSGCAVIFVGIIKFTPSRAVPTNGNRAVTQSECEARTETERTAIGALDQKVDTLQIDVGRRFDRVDKGFDRLERALKDARTKE